VAEAVFVVVHRVSHRIKDVGPATDVRLPPAGHIAAGNSVEGGNGKAPGRGNVAARVRIQLMGGEREVMQASPGCYWLWRMLGSKPSYRRMGNA
jgi:hypothetical protein